MSWANLYIARLAKGETVTFRPMGHSMTGLIESGQKVTLEPLSRDPEVEDIVLCRVAGKQYLHRVVAIKNDRYTIGNNKGFVNGAVPRAQIFGICVKIEP